MWISIQTVFNYKDKNLECFENIFSGYQKIYNSEMGTLAVTITVVNNTLLFLEITHYCFGLILLTMSQLKFYSNQLKV